MPRSWLADLRSRLGGGARTDGGIGILAFEAAAAMSRLVSLHWSLSEVEVRRLRADALRSEGVARLTSTDQSLLLRLACAELVADLDRAADTAARLGARCCCAPDAPFVHDFDRVYAEAKRGSLARLDAVVGFSNGAAKRFKKMERHVVMTSKLYKEMDALTELESSERRMEQWKQHSGPIPVQASRNQADKPSEKLMHELRSQRQRVRRLMEGSLWSVANHRVAKLMGKSVLAVLARISIAFGASVPGLPPLVSGRTRALAIGYSSSGLLHRATPLDAAIRHSAPIFLRPKDTALSVSGAAIKPPATTVGGSGMELRYAKVILSAETLLMALQPVIHGEEVQNGIELSMRDELYKMLPVTIRAAVRAKLRESRRGQQVVDGEAASVAMGAVDKVLRWLGPMAHDTMRWHDDRSMERGHRFSMRPHATMVQTLHFADRQKAEASIVEVLVGLSCVCWYHDERRRPTGWDD